MLQKLGNVYFELDIGGERINMLVVEEIEDFDGNMTHRFVAKGWVYPDYWPTWIMIRDIIDELIREDEKKYGRLRPVLDALNEVIPEEG